MGVLGGVVGIFCASSKIDDLLTEDDGPLHVLPLAVHLIFFADK